MRRCGRICEEQMGKGDVVGEVKTRCGEEMWRGRSGQRCGERVCGAHAVYVQNLLIILAQPPTNVGERNKQATK